MPNVIYIEYHCSHGEVKNDHPFLVQHYASAEIKPTIDCPFHEDGKGTAPRVVTVIVN